jgi:predicted Zn-dependent peptidase
MSDLYQKSVLPSGLTVVTERMLDRASISVGVWVRCGARDEPQTRLGISHFIEHMMFKGTDRRDARSIAASLESLGGHLDAFTAREHVCYYARAMAEHLPEVVDVLSDILCRSRFAKEDMEREKSVVREEIFAAEDNPDDKIGELLCQEVWGGHALGLPILGTVETVHAFEPDALRDYFRSRYRGDQLVVAASGAIDHGRLVALAGEGFTPPSGEALPLSGAPPGFTAAVRHVRRPDLQQLLVSLGTRGLAYGDEGRYPLYVLNTLLGGGMSSRLFQTVREEAGLAYSVYSSVEFHRDAGMLGIHMGVAPDKGRVALERVRSELVKLLDEGPTEEEVASARSQIRGGMLIGQESVSNRMFHLAHDEIYRGRFHSLEEDVARVMAVTREQVASTARRFLDPAGFTLVALGPTAGDTLDERFWAAA